MTKQLSLLCFVALLFAFFLIPVRADDLDLIGRANIIAMGTVLEVINIADAPLIASGQATIHVDKLFKGTPGADALTFRYIAPALRIGQQMPCPLINMQAGQKLLFFLQRSPYGYAPVQGDWGVQPADKAGTVAKLIASFPLEVTLEKPVGPFYFGKETSVRLKITNNGDQPLRYSDIKLEGFYASPRLSELLFIMLPVLNNAFAEPLIPPGGTHSAYLQVTIEQPEAWRIFPADSYLQTLVAVRAVISAQQSPANQRETPAPFIAASPWVDSMAGFPLPTDPTLTTVVTPRVNLAPLLATYREAGPNTRTAVVQVLLKEAAVNPAVIAAMKTEIAQRQAAMALRAQLPETDADVRQRLETEILQQVLQESAWGTNPREQITTWVHKQKFPDGQAFTRECTPLAVMQDSLAILFPDYLFYTIYFPGYFGGVPPTAEMLRNYMTPPPLEQINIFAIKHDGTITLLTDQKSREAFFYAQLPAVKTEVQARIVATSWLRLQQEFVRKLYLQPSFTITPADFRVTIIQTYPEKLEVTGKAIVTPGTQITGEISVKLLFANDGKLQRVTEEQHVEFPLIPPPP